MILACALVSFALGFLVARLTPVARERGLSRVVPVPLAMARAQRARLLTRKEP